MSAEGNVTAALSGGSNMHFEEPLWELYFVMGMLLFFSFLGTTGNALVMYVFKRKRDKSVSTLFILSLAFVDFITCLIVMPFTVYMEYFTYYISYDILCKTYQFLITSNIPFSAFVMVAIAIDRYFCICHPFLHAMNPRRAKVIIACLALCASSLGIITCLNYGVYHKAQQPVPGRVRVAIFNQTLLLNQSDANEVAYSYKSDGLHPEPIGNETLVNYTYEWQNKSRTVIIYSMCMPNFLILTNEDFFTYQKVYTSTFVVAAVIVIVLYVLIYRSVMARRKKRQKQKSKAVVTTKTQVEESTAIMTQAATQTTVLDTKLANHEDSTTKQNGTETRKAGKSGGRDRKKSSRKMMKKDNRIANLKTAAMLFVVTIVFIVTYLPALLMAITWIPFNRPVFYMYFANNVANPVIYSFMNRNFRDDLKRIFNCRGGL